MNCKVAQFKPQEFLTPRTAYDVESIQDGFWDLFPVPDGLVTGEWSFRERFSQASASPERLGERSPLPQNLENLDRAGNYQSTLTLTHSQRAPEAEENMNFFNIYKFQ